MSKRWRTIPRLRRFPMTENSYKIKGTVLETDGEVGETRNVRDESWINRVKGLVRQKVKKYRNVYDKEEWEGNGWVGRPYEGK